MRLTLDELDSLPIPLSIKQKLEELESSEYFDSFDPAGLKALRLLIKDAISQGWSEEKILRIFFNPVKPTDEELEIFRARHQSMYQEQAVDLAHEIESLPDQFFTITSSMYAGKSTLAAEISNQLANKGYRVIPMVPFFMSDDENANFITLRGQVVKEGDDVGPDGFKRIKAESYHPGNFVEMIQSLNIDPTEKAVMHFDEFSFLDGESILQFIHFMQENYPNVKVLFVGLNKNALGADLAGYVASLSVVRKQMVCKSFVPNDLETIDDQTLPTGTYTSRYVVLPNGFKVLDCGFLPVVVPKECSMLVQYTPCNAYQHLSIILAEMEEVELLNSILYPNQDQINIRQSLFDRLKPAPQEA